MWMARNAESLVVTGFTTDAKYALVFFDEANLSIKKFKALDSYDIGQAAFIDSNTLLISLFS